LTDLPAAAPSYAGLLRENTDFRRLWLGEVVSYFGDWFKMIALYAMVQQISDSALAVSGVIVGTTLPVFLVIPIAGPLVDRFDRRKVLLATDLIRASLVVGLLAAHHLQSLPLLYATLAVMVGCSGVFIPARTAVIPEITTKAELPVAMALSGGTWSVMLAVGAAIGGVVTGFVGIDGALILDSATFLGSFAILWGLPALRPSSDHAEGSDPGLRAGLRYLRRRPYLAGVLCHKPAMGLAGASLAMLPIFGKSVFTVGGPLYIGLLYSTRGIGSVFGSLGVRRVIGDAERTLAWAIVPAYSAMAAGLVTVAYSPTFAVAALGYLLMALGQGTIWVFSGTLAQHASDSAYRGRAFSLEFGVMTLATSTSSVLGGAAVDAGWTGVRGVVGASAAWLAVPLVVWTLALPALLRSRTAPAPAAEDRDEIPLGPPV